MGKGKGGMDAWVAVVKPGKVLYEMAGVEPEIAKEAMALAASKLPFGTKFLVRDDEI